MERLACLMMLGVLPALGAVEFDAIYGDGMVLQRGREVVVRGTTDKPSEPVTVSFNGQKVKAEKALSGSPCAESSISPPQMDVPHIPTL